MRHRFPTLKAFLQATVKNPNQWVRFCYSPGGAAATLGVSRQRVGQLIDSNQLEAVSTADGYVMLDYDEVLRRRRRMAQVDSVKRKA